MPDGRPGPSIVRTHLLRSPSPRARRAPRRRWNRRETLVAYALLSPWIIGMAAFYLGPMLASLAYSFTRYPIIAAPTWAGTDNYKRLAHDDLFFTALKVTTLYTIAAVTLYIGSGLALALLANRNTRGIGVLRTMIFLPSLIPVWAMAVLFSWLFNKDFGPVNWLLGELGIPPQGFFQSTGQALWLCVLVSFWAAGSAFVVFLAGLQSVPQHLYEAITVDGAGPLRRFWHVTLPMLSPVILFNLVIGIVLSFQVFDVAWAVTEGGPANATLFFVLYIWRVAFQNFEMGYASALAWTLFLIIGAVTAMVFRTSRHWVHYEAQR
jgi:multiple sugar transport system permease protein